MADIPSHHMIYGTIIDYASGRPVVDTDDERYRQKLQKIFVEEKGFDKRELEVGLKIETLFARQFVVSKIDFVVTVNGKRIILVRYGPGSLVTRERPAIAAARVLDRGRIIPLVVVTNGEDAELLETRSGKVLSHGLESLPDREGFLRLVEGMDDRPIPEKQREPELRILNAFDVEICCAGGPCALPGAPDG